MSILKVGGPDPRQRRRVRVYRVKIFRISLDVPRQQSDGWCARIRIRRKGSKEVKAFTIDADNNIMVHGSVGTATKSESTEVFTSEKALNALAEKWPGSRLIEIWNSIPGVTTVRKFKDRATAIARIWKAIQSLTAPVEETEPTVAPAKASKKKKATTAVKTP
jgi:hypothetical protein